VQAPSSKIWSRDFILLFLTSFLTWGSFHFLLPTLPLYIADVLKGTPTQVGIISSLLALSTVLTRPLVGFALDRWGRRPVYLLSLFLLCLVAFAYNLATSLLLLAAIRVLQSVPFGGSSTASTTIASDLVPVERRGEGLGLFDLSGTLSMAIAPAVALAVLGNGQFSRLFNLSGCMLLAALLFALPVRYRPVGRTRAAFTLSNLLERRVGWLALAIACAYFCFGGVISFITLYAERYRIAGAGWFFTAYATGLVLSRTVGGRFFDRYGPRVPAYAGLALEAVALLLLGLWRSQIGFMTAAVLFGFGLGAITPPIFAMAVSWVPDDRRGAANATVFAGIDLGIGVGSNVLGAVAQASNYAVMYGVSSLLLAVPLAIFALKIVPRYREVKRETGNVRGEA